MFSCIKLSIKGNIKDTIFTQFGNLPTHEDGIALFKKIATFTTVTSLQLSMLSFNNILNFNPFDYKFNTHVIHRKIIHLFILATTSSRTLFDSEKIQHISNVYVKLSSHKRSRNRSTIKSMFLTTVISRYVKIS